MFTVGNSQSVAKIIGCDKIAQHKGRTTFLYDIGQIFNRDLYICFPAFRLKVNQLTNDIKNMLPPFLGRNKFLNPVREEYDPNFIIVLNRGKRQFPLTDGSMVRLTVSHYYTPSGRCIQKPYKRGDNYEAEVFERYASGELVSADSIEVTDTTKYYTKVKHRLVYGGGGIIPDVFVPIDTGVNYSYFNRLLAKGVVSEYAMNYVDRHRAELEKKYSKFEEFQKKFEVTDEMVEEIVAEGEKQGVKKDEALLGPVMPELRLFVKSLLARDLWGMTELYRVSNESNKILNEAVKVLQDGSYDNLLN